MGYTIYEVEGLRRADEHLAYDSEDFAFTFLSSSLKYSNDCGLFDWHFAETLLSKLVCPSFVLVVVVV